MEFKRIQEFPFSEEVLFTPLCIDEFLRIMEKYNFPFTVDNSFAADFFIYGSSAEKDIKIILCIPDCFTVAKNYIEKNSPEIMKEIMSNGKKAKLFKNMKNFRDILIEGFNMIYVNNWEIHTSRPLGEAQKIALLRLSMEGYVNSDIFYKNSIVFHDSILKTLVQEGKAIKINGKRDMYSYYISFSSLSRAAKAGVIADDVYHRFLEIKEIPTLEENFYCVDTSNHVVDFICKKDIERKNQYDI